MNNNKTILVLYFIFQFKYIYGFDFKFNGTSIDDIKSKLKIISHDHDEFGKLEIDVLNNIHEINFKNIDDLEFDSQQNINFFNKKNLILFYVKNLLKELNDFKSAFLNIKNTDFLEFLMINNIYDFNSHFTIIEKFLKNYNEKTINYLSNSDRFDSKILYETYIKEIELTKFQKAIENFYHDLHLCRYIFYSQIKNKTVLILNKRNILTFINNIRKKRIDNNITFSFIKSDIYDLICKDDEEKNEDLLLNDCETIELKLVENKNMMIEINKIISVMNELEELAEIIDNSLKKSNNVMTKKVKSEINSYQKAVNRFLSDLNSFFLIFNDIRTKNGIFCRDFGVLLFLKIVKSILYTKVNFKPNINYVFNKLLIDEELRISQVLKIQTYLDRNNDYFHLKNKKNIIDIIHSFIELNEYIFSYVDEVKFKEFLSYDLSNKLEKFYNLSSLILKYLKVNDKKEMQFEILKKTINFLNNEFSNNENRIFDSKSNFTNNEVNFDISKILELINKFSKLQNYKLTQNFNSKLDFNDIIFLKLIFDLFHEIYKKVFENDYKIINYLKKDEDVPFSLIMLFNFILSFNLHKNK